MKVKFIAIALLLSGTLFAQQQQPQATLVCDSSTFKKDTTLGTIMYLDSTTSKMVVDRKGKLIRVICRLMYQGNNGAPNAPTQQAGVQSAIFYTQDKKPLNEKWIIKFIY